MKTKLFYKMEKSCFSRRRDSVCAINCEIGIPLQMKMMKGERKLESKLKLHIILKINSYLIDIMFITCKDHVCRIHTCSKFLMNFARNSSRRSQFGEGAMKWFSSPHRRWVIKVQCCYQVIRLKKEKQTFKERGRERGVSRGGGKYRGIKPALPGPQA